MNKQIIRGYVGRDPMIKNLPGGELKARFTVAVTDKWKDKKTGEWMERTEWFTVEAWKYLAERVERDIKKGVPVYVEGKTVTERWKDKETGEDRSAKVVKAADIVLLVDRPRSGFDQKSEKGGGEDGAF